MGKKVMAVNLAASLLSFIINLGISFFLTPFIVSRLGREAYGFIGLINNLISYVSILTIALNSMAGRFITVKIHQGRRKEANIYFNSVLIGNTIMAMVFAIITLIMLINLGSFINIPENLYEDVRIAFLLVSVEFIISFTTSVFGIATFVRNKLYLSSLNEMKSNVLRVCIIILLFMFLPPRIFYISIATLAASIFIIIVNVYFTIKLLPEIGINRKCFQFTAVAELIKSGIWNVFNRLSQILNTGLDLLLANIFLGASLMGTLSISKTIPNCFIAFTSTIVVVFAPQLTISYAQNSMKEIVDGTKQSIKIMTLFTSLFFAFIIVYSKEFYNLWMPGQNADFIYILTVLAVFHMPVTSGMNSLYNIFTITNKVKKSSLILMGNSIINAIIIIVSAKVMPSSYSIYIIAGTSSLLALLIALFFVIPYAAICLNLKKRTFLTQLYTCVVGNALMIVIFLLVKLIFTKNYGWINLFISLTISSIIGVFLNLYILMNRQERKFIIDKILRRK